MPITLIISPKQFRFIFLKSFSRQKTTAVIAFKQGCKVFPMGKLHKEKQFLRIQGVNI